MGTGFGDYLCPSKVRILVIPYTLVDSIKKAIGLLPHILIDELDEKGHH